MHFFFPVANRALHFDRLSGLVVTAMANLLRSEEGYDGFDGVIGHQVQ